MPGRSVSWTAVALVLASALAPARAPRAEAASGAAAQRSAVRLFDLERGGLAGELAGLPEDVARIALSPDERTVAIVSADGAVELWDARTGRRYAVLPASGVSAVAFAPDGRFVVTGASDGAVTLWHRETGHEFLKLGEGPEMPLSVTFSPDGRFVVAGGNDEIRLWDANSGHLLRAFRGEMGDVSHMAFSPDGRFLVQGGTSGDITVWEPATAMMVGRLSLGSPISALAVSPLGVIAAAIEGNYSVQLFETTARPMRSLHGHVSTVTALAFKGPDSLVSASLDRSVLVWDVRTGKETRALEGTDDNITNLAVVNAGRVLVTASSARKPTLHVLAIGLDQYRDRRFALRYAVADAKAFADATSAAAARSGRYGDVRVNVITNAEGTTATILRALERIAQEADAEDTFAFFYAGGSLLYKADASRGPELLLVPADLEEGDVESRERLLTRSLASARLRAWIDRVPAERKLLVFDLVPFDKTDALSRFGADVATQNVALDELTEGSAVVLTGLEPHVWEIESGRVGNGLVAYFLVEGLEGKADRDRDGLVSARELAGYVSENAARVAKIPDGYPVRAVGDDFPLGRVGRVVPRDASRRHGSLAASVTKVSTRWAERPAQTAGEPNRGTARVGPGGAPSDGVPLGKRIALLIATDEYDDLERLNNPLGDARTIAEQLRSRYAFDEAEVLPNPRQVEILAALKRYKERSYAPGDQLFIFFAGHGVYDKGDDQGYIAARDSDRKEDDEFYLTYVPHFRLRAAVDKIPCEHILLVLDVCFGGAIRDLNPGGAPQGADAADGSDPYAPIPTEVLIRRKLRLRTRQFITSGGLTYVSDGKPGSHSPFAARVIATLEEGGGRRGYVSVPLLRLEVEDVRPGPAWGRFGSDVEGSDFFFVLARREPSASR
jgi:uncharacterized caspase-like protein